MMMNMEQKDTARFHLDICLSSFLYLPATKLNVFLILTHWLL